MSGDVLDRAQVIIGHTDVSGETIGFTPNPGGDIHEYTPMNYPAGMNPGVRKIGGNPNDSANLEGVISAAELPAVLLFQQRLLDMPVSAFLNVAGAEASVGDLVIFGDAVQASPQLMFKQGDLKRWTCAFQADWALYAGYCLAMGQQTGNWNGAGVELGAAAEGQHLHLLLQVIAADSGNSIVHIERDSDNTFSSPVTVHTFTNPGTTPQSQVAHVKVGAGGWSDTWFRAVGTTTSSPDHNIGVAAAIFE